MTEKRNNKKVLVGGGIGVIAIITVIILVLNFMGTSEDRLNAKIQNNRAVVTLQGEVGALRETIKDTNDRVKNIEAMINEMRKENRNRNGGR